MHVIITAGPTREYIDSVRFLTNGSSGQMGCAVAVAALEAGHRVTLLLAQGVLESSAHEAFFKEAARATSAAFDRAAEADPSLWDRAIAADPTLQSEEEHIASYDPESVPLCVMPFVSVADLREALEKTFASADALVMAAAVGDFRAETVSPIKLRRRGGPITVRLIPTEDILASVAATKRPGQRIVAFAVEDGPPDEIEARARAELIEKNGDFVVVNPPAAMGSARSQACILTRNGVALPWADRPKTTLAAEIVKLLEGC